MFVPYIQVNFRLDFFIGANNTNSDQTAPKGSKGSNLIWVHIVCNIGYLRTKADKRSRQQVVTVWLRLKLYLLVQLEEISLSFRCCKVAE